jgi:hypothetical protein
VVRGVCLEVFMATELSVKVSRADCPPPPPTRDSLTRLSVREICIDSKRSSEDLHVDGGIILIRISQSSVPEIYKWSSTG